MKMIVLLIFVEDAFWRSFLGSDPLGFGGSSKKGLRFSFLNLSCSARAKRFNCNFVGIKK